jgi:pheromone shutdown-related protein TraB
MLPAKRRAGKRTHLRESNTMTQEPSACNAPDYPPDVQVVSVQGRTFILVGTAHVSQASAVLVREVITREKPDCVCVELDHHRYTALSQQRRLEDLDLKTIIRNRQLSPLIANVVLASYQKRLGGQLGVLPGAEMLEALSIARACDIPIAFCDRDVRITLRRAWRFTPFFKKFLLLSSLLSSIFDTTELSEEILHDIRQQDALSEMLRELGDMLPTLRTVLIDERDTYLAQHIRQTSGERVVAVLGAAHIPGVHQALLEERQHNLDALNVVPPVSPLWHWLQWSIPATIVAALCLIGWQKGAAVAGQNVLFWILATGIPSALGALVALAHPLTIVTAFVAAPVTTLSPVIGAGYVTAFVQAYLCPPLVRELHSVADDVRRLPQWWRNRLLRIFLAFMLPSIGSMIGIWIGGYELVSNLF